MFLFQNENLTMTKTRLENHKHFKKSSLQVFFATEICIELLQQFSWKLPSEMKNVTMKAASNRGHQTWAQEKIIKQFLIIIKCQRNFQASSTFVSKD